MKLFKYIFMATLLLSGCGSNNNNNWEVKIISSEHGKITSNVSNAKVGDNVTFKIVEDENYLLSSFLINSVDYISYVDKNLMSFTTQMVEGGLHVKGVFALDENLYPVTISFSGNGTVTATSSSAKIGESVRFTIKANSYYSVSSFKVNNIEKKADLIESNNEYIYQTNMVKNGLSTEAVFTKSDELFDVHIYEGIENGVIVCDKANAKIGEEVCFHITPNYLYELTSLGLDYYDESGKHAYKSVLSEVDKSTKPYIFVTEMTGGGIYLDGGFSLDVVSSCFVKEPSTDNLYSGGSFKIDFSFKNIKDVNYVVNSITLKINPKNHTIDEKYVYDYQLTPQNKDTWASDGYFSILIDKYLGGAINKAIYDIYNLQKRDEVSGDTTYPFTLSNMIGYFGNPGYWYIEVNYSVLNKTINIVDNLLVARDEYEWQDRFQQQ